MKGLYLVVRRELEAYFNSIWGYIVVAAKLVIDGLLFNAFALGASPRLSETVLRQFFYFSFGTTIAAGILLTMPLIARERQEGTIALLDSSPLSDWEIVGGKWLSAFLFVTLMTLLTIYMPALIFVNGKVSVGHIVAGYLGLISVGAVTTAIGTFASTLTRSQLIAGVFATIISVFFLIAWLLAKVVAVPFDSVLSYLAIFNAHFARSFMDGRIPTEDLVYHASVTFAFLMLAVRWFTARRWS